MLQLLNPGVLRQLVQTLSKYPGVWGGEKAFDREGNYAKLTVNDQPVVSMSGDIDPSYAALNVTIDTANSIANRLSTKGSVDIDGIAGRLQTTPEGVPVLMGEGFDIYPLENEIVFSFTGLGEPFEVLRIMVGDEVTAVEIAALLQSKPQHSAETTAHDNDVIIDNGVLTDARTE